MCNRRQEKYGRIALYFLPAHNITEITTCRPSWLFCWRQASLWNVPSGSLGMNDVGKKTPKPTTSAILIIRVAISRELDMWIVEIRIGCINIHLVRRFVTKICIEFELLSFYCTSSHNQTFEKSWTGFDEWHGIEVRIPNDGDSWDAKSEYFLRILPLFLQLNQSVFRQRPFKSLRLKIDSNFVTGISPSCLGLRQILFREFFSLFRTMGIDMKTSHVNQTTPKRSFQMNEDEEKVVYLCRELILIIFSCFEVVVKNDSSTAV